MPSHATTLTARFTYNPGNPSEPTGSQTGVDNVADAVTLVARNYTRMYGEANPTFGYDVNFGTITSGTPVITCSATQDSLPGTYDIIISKGTVSNSAVNLVNGMLTVLPVMGDINGDGKVDVSDYIGVANHILGNTPEGFDAGAADVNNDGVVDVSDYIGVANIILTGSPYGK